MVKKWAKLIWSSPTITQWAQSLMGISKFLILAPFLLRVFEADEIAVWYLFYSITALTQLLDFGFFSSFSRMVSYTMAGAKDITHFEGNDPKKHGDGTANWPLMQKLYGTIGSIYLILTGIVFISLAIFGTIFVYRTVTLAGGGSDLWIAWIILFCGFTLIFFGKKYQSVLIGMNKVALVNRCLFFSQVISLILSIGILLYMPSILYLIIIQQLASIIAMIIMRFYLLKLENKKYRAFKPFSLDKKLFRSVWAPAWRSGLSDLSNRGVSQGSGIIFAQFGATPDVAAYLFSLRLITVIYQLALAPYVSHIPVFSKLRAQGKLEKLAALTNRQTNIGLLIFSLAACLTGIFIEPLLVLIKANVAFVPVAIWALMMVAWFYDMHNFTRIQLYYTTNKIIYYKHYIASAIIFLVLVALTLGRWGIVGIILAQLVSRVVIFNWQPLVKSLKSVHQNIFIYLKKVVVLNLLLLAVAIVILLMAKY